MLRLIWLVPALPLAGAVINLFFGKRLGKWAGILGSATVGASFVFALLALAGLLGLAAEERVFVRPLFDWITVGDFKVAADLRVDALSTVMILVVTGVGFLIHAYAIGYMDGDPRFCSSSSCSLLFSPTTSYCSTSDGKASASAPTC